MDNVEQPPFRIASDTRPIQRPAIDMAEAQKVASDQAYEIASRSRRDAYSLQWRCPTVELVSVAVGQQGLLLYRAVIILEKQRGFGRGYWRFEFQIDPQDGRVIGLRDDGWTAT